MKKSFLLFLITIFVLSACNGPHAFTQRKYFDFKNKQSEALLANETLELTKTTNELGAVSVNIKTDLALEESTPEVTTISNVIVDKSFVKNTYSGGSLQSMQKSPTEIIKATRLQSKAKNFVTDNTKVKGKLWWVFMIVAFIGLLIALVVSALIGTLLMLVGIALGVVMLIMYWSSKKKQGKTEVNEKPSRDNKPNKPTKEPKKQKRG